MYDVVYQLPIETQIALLASCRKIIQEAPLFQKTMPRWGHKFKYLCTSAGRYGWTSDKKGFRYVETHPTTQENFPEMPDIIHDIAVETAEKCGMTIRPESALINRYTADSTLGLHVDNTEKCDAPVISISLGDDCLFIKGGIEKDSPKEIVTLHSGDVFVMGGEYRYCYHGVKEIIAGTAPQELKMQQPGRVNITIRQVYE